MERLTDERTDDADREQGQQGPVDLPVEAGAVSVVVGGVCHRVLPRALLRDVEEGEQEDPNQVDEVPVVAD
ncbi:hypothetical protein D3C83_203150 [compost metagenome]